MSIKVCGGFSVRFCTSAPKTGRAGSPRKEEHVWSLTADQYSFVLGVLQNEGVTVNGENYKFTENSLLSDHPRFAKERPIWSGAAVVRGQVFECHVFEGTVPVSLVD